MTTTIVKRKPDGDFSLQLYDGNRLVQTLTLDALDNLKRERQELKDKYVRATQAFPLA